MDYQINSDSMHQDELNGENQAIEIPGICKLLGELKPSATITESALSKLMGKHVVSIKRAIERQELPPPVKLFDQRVWTVGVIISYLERRLEFAQKKLDKERKKLHELNP